MNACFQISNPAEAVKAYQPILDMSWSCRCLSEAVTGAGMGPSTLIEVQKSEVFTPSSSEAQRLDPFLEHRCISSQPRTSACLNCAGAWWRGQRTTCPKCPALQHVIVMRAQAVDSTFPQSRDHVVHDTSDSGSEADQFRRLAAWKHSPSAALFRLTLPHRHPNIAQSVCLTESSGSAIGVVLSSGVDLLAHDTSLDKWDKPCGGVAWPCGKQHPPSRSRVLHICADIASALIHIHSFGITLGSLDPSDVLLVALQGLGWDSVEPCHRAQLYNGQHAAFLNRRWRGLDDAHPDTWLSFAVRQGEDDWFGSHAMVMPPECALGRASGRSVACQWYSFLESDTWRFGALLWQLATGNHGLPPSLQELRTVQVCKGGMSGWKAALRARGSSALSVRAPFPLPSRDPAVTQP